MKVSRRKWHFKLYTFWLQSWDWGSRSPWEFLFLLTRRHSLELDWYRPKNLCRYFWTTFLLSIVSVFLLVCCNVVIALIIAVCYPCFVLAERFGGWKKERRYKKGLPPKDPKEGPGLVRSFIRAKKQKVCPLIEVVD